MDQIIVSLQQFGAGFTHFTHLDVTSILVGLVLADIPWVFRRAFGRLRGQG